LSLDIPIVAGFLCDTARMLDAAVKRKDRQRTYSAALRRLGVTIIAVEKQ
jgi:hypothetical protein